MTPFLWFTLAYVFFLIVAAVDVVRSRRKLASAERALLEARRANARLAVAKLRELGVPVRSDPLCPRDSIYIVNPDLLRWAPDKEKP